jgi:hypothetical protein
MGGTHTYWSTKENSKKNVKFAPKAGSVADSRARPRGATTRPGWGGELRGCQAYRLVGADAIASIGARPGGRAGTIACHWGWAVVTR